MNKNLPNWYWVKGLHDAQIISYEEVELEYDYAQMNLKRNYLQINLNSRLAMYDTSIKAIRFYNYKCDNLKELVNAIWLEDDLQKINDKFKLTISLSKLNGHFPDVIIKFDDAEVFR